MEWDFFLGYSAKDRDKAQELSKAIQKAGMTTWMSMDVQGSSFYDSIREAIRNSKCYLVLISRNSLNSDWVRKELEYAVSTALDRDKIIVPVLFAGVDLKEDPVFSYLLSGVRIYNVDENTPDWADKLLDQIRPVLALGEQKNLLYAQILELKKGNDGILTAKKTCELIRILANDLQTLSNENQKIDCLFELERLYKILSETFLGYGEEEKNAAKEVLSTVQAAFGVYSLSLVTQKTLLAAAIIAIILYFDHEIRNDAVDTWTYGDYQFGRNEAYKTEQYMEWQAPYKEYLLTHSPETGLYTEDELAYIKESEKYIFRSPDDVSVRSGTRTEQSTPDDNYTAIAEYIQQGNKLFEVIGKDARSFEFYKCLITSYERLKNYCLEVGAHRIYSECVLKTTELKQMADSFGSGAADSMEAEKRIKALLGLTLPKSGEYDAFISYKHYDSDRAKKVCDYLHRNLKEVFFDKESLPELSKSDYEHAVMEALDRSKHFIVIISDITLLQSSSLEDGDWVRREMRAFNTEIQEGRKNGSNFIILASDEVCDRVFADNKRMLDIMWRWPEIIRFRDFESVLASYIK